MPWKSKSHCSNLTLFVVRSIAPRYRTGRARRAMADWNINSIQPGMMRWVKGLAGNDRLPLTGRPGQGAAGGAGRVAVGMKER